MEKQKYKQHIEQSASVYHYSLCVVGSLHKIQMKKSSIIYHIFIDRFAGNMHGNPMHNDYIGGNLKGINEKIVYIASLGVDIIWLSPFYENTSYHGYHITNYETVDKHFGTTEDLCNLIETAHNYNIKVIADFVPNHCSRHHPFFVEAIKNKDSRYWKWFYFTRWPKKYLSFLHFSELPKINLEHEEAATYFIKVAKYWLSLGLDGYRIDHVVGISHKYLKRFNTEIKASYPKSIIIGEAWIEGINLKQYRTLKIRSNLKMLLTKNAQDTIQLEYIDELDGVLDFRANRLIREHFCWNPPLHKNLSEELQKHYSKYPEIFLLPVFLDNHDMERFMWQCGNDISKFKNAINFIFTLKQPIILYYGTEHGMTQNKSISGKNGNDIFARQMMQWNNLNEENILFFKALAIKRKSIF